MNFKVTTDKIDQVPSETAALFFHIDERPLTGSSGLVDWRLCGQISRLLISGMIAGDTGEQVLLASQGRIGAEKIMLFGLGSTQTFSFERYGRTMSLAAKALRKMRADSVVLSLPDIQASSMDQPMAIRRLADELYAWYRDDAALLGSLSMTIVVPLRQLRETSEIIDRLPKR